jgi:hypothetical protein
MRLISRSFLPMAMAVAAEGLPVFWETEGLRRTDVLGLDFINKGYKLNVHILYIILWGLTIFVKCRNQVVGDHLGGPAFNMMTFNHMNQLTVFKQGYSRRRWRIRQ